MIQKVKKCLAWRTTCEGGAEGLEEALKQEEVNPVYTASWMSEKFKLLIGFPKVKIEVVNKILTEAGESGVNPDVDLTSIVDYYTLLNRLESVCGMDESRVVSYRLRKRKANNQTNIKTAVYQRLNHKERREKIHQSLWHFRKYNRCLLVAGKLRGRLMTLFDPYITGLCARVDKSGMATQIFTPDYFMLGDGGMELIREDSKVDILSVLFAADEFDYTLSGNLII